MTSAGMTSQLLLCFILARLGDDAEVGLNRASASAELIQTDRDHRDDDKRHAEPHPLFHHACPRFLLAWRNLFTWRNLVI